MDLDGTRHALRWLTAWSRMAGALLAAALLSIAVGRNAFTAVHATSDNAVVLENQQPGSTDWMFTNLGDDVAQQIKGYASATSVNPNENITFFVSVNPAQTYTIDIYRIGWYGGAGGRLRLHVGPIDGAQQPP